MVHAGAFDEYVSPAAANGAQDYALAFNYHDNARGASTDLSQRAARLEALRAAVLA